MPMSFAVSTAGNEITQLTRAVERDGKIADDDEAVIKLETIRAIALEPNDISALENATKPPLTSDAFETAKATFAQLRTSVAAEATTSTNNLCGTFTSVAVLATRKETCSDANLEIATALRDEEANILAV